MNYEFKATHHGSFLGVPALIDLRDEECPAVLAKYGRVGEFAMWIMENLFIAYCYVCVLFDDRFEPLFPIKIGEAINED